jgi:two-component system cell cycle response regulator DivK
MRNSPPSPSIRRNGASARKSTVAGSEKPKVLIVEDDPDLLKIFRILLETNGYEVVTASYALPALFRVVRKEPDLILADLNMPLMNGLELLAQLKSHAETKDIPVVVVTGSNSPEDREAAFKAGCSGYVNKPFDTREFLKQIAALRNVPMENSGTVPVSAATNQPRL